MAINNSCKTLFPGFGNVTEYVSVLGTALTPSSTVSIVLTGFTNGIRSGRVRIKSNGAAATAAISAGTIVGTDGTNNVQLNSSLITVAASTLFDYLFDFITDFTLTTVTIALTLGAGTTGAIDAEIAANP